MLEIRPTCERCAKALPPDSQEAMICSFECTFCATCVTEVLHNVCPNCTGGFQFRPIRPKNELSKHPAKTEQIQSVLDNASFELLQKQYKEVAPHLR